MRDEEKHSFHPSSLIFMSSSSFMRSILIQLLIAFLSLLSWSANVAACSCVDTPSPCASFREAPVVFIGLVKEIHEELVDIESSGKTDTIRTSLTARFIVETALKGIDSREVDVVTGGGHGDCGYNFVSGESYLVYAFRTEEEALSSSMSRTVIGGGNNSAKKAGALTTNICSRTRRFENARDDLDLIQAVVKGKPQSRIFGSVDEYVTKIGDIERDAQYRPKAGLTIKVEGAAGKFEASTDTEGHFRMDGLKPGRYRVQLLLPANYGMQFSFDRNETAVEVTRGCSGVEINFNIRIDGRISGRLYDAQGKPLGKDVQVSLLIYEPAGNPAALISRNEYTDAQGRYEFDGLPPGRYVLGINLDDAPTKNTPYQKMYYPSANTLAQAAVISVGEGQKINDYDLHLSKPLAERTITGTVLLQNGQPAVGARVEIYDLEKPDKAVWGMRTETDRQGSFTIRAFKGRHYKLHAYLSENYIAGTGVQSEMVEVDSAAGDSPLKIILNRPGIFRDQQ